jgi:hypothetical protein
MSALFHEFGRTMASSYARSDLANARRSPSFSSPCPKGCAIASDTSGIRR